MFKFILGLILVNSSMAVADTIEFSDAELATETVLPVFERSRSVLNRTVETTGHLELGFGGGLALNEPFYNPINFNANATYHFTDIHAANLSATYFMAGLNSYGEQLKSGKNMQPYSFDPSEAPAPSFLLLGNYQFNAYYGKISLSKQAVMNLNLFGLLGAGVMQTGGLSNIALNAGFGQNFYLTPKLAARFDLKLVMYNGPDETSQDLTTGGTKPSESAFDTEWIFKTYLSLGLIYIL